MSKNTYWITTTNGIHGQVEGVEERDKWTPLGWFVVDEPKLTDFVYMRKDGIAEPAQFAYGAAPTWEAMGWQYCPPPAPYDVTKDALLFDQDTRAAAQESKTKPTTKTGPAAGSDKN